MQDLFFSGFECVIATNSTSTRKREKIDKKRKGFHPNIQELFHCELYGSFPTAGKTPLPVLKPIKNTYPIRLVPFNVAYANKDYILCISTLMTHCFLGFCEIRRSIWLFFRNVILSLAPISHSISICPMRNAIIVLILTGHSLHIYKGMVST